MRGVIRTAVVMGLMLPGLPYLRLGSAAQAQTTPPQGKLSADPPVPDPLQVGEAALAKGEFAEAQSFFTRYLAEDPQDNRALFFEGNAELGLKNYAAAKARYTAALAMNPKLWSAHQNLVIVYAAQGDWKNFDAERAALAAAHAAHDPGLPAQLSYVIDQIELNGQRYIVHAYDPPVGRFHAKYNFAHLDANGKLLGWISCESDDVDQANFAKMHPDAAARGERSYSLDSYSPVTKLPSGQLSQSQGLIKFYWDGEPSYETVRADVLRVISGQAAPAASTTSTAQP